MQFLDYFLEYHFNGHTLNDTMFGFWLLLIRRYYLRYLITCSFDMCFCQVSSERSFLPEYIYEVNKAWKLKCYAGNFMKQKYKYQKGLVV